ncbi:MAG: PA2779 family protein [Pseudomonadales bacterium]|nr:PA2779 family protein [Pseudomonadales bacterium]
MLVRLRNKTRQSFVLSIVIAFLSLGAVSSAQAGIVSAGKAVQAESQVDHMDNVKAFLARADVQANLESLGVDSATAEKRVAALSPEELATLSNKIDEVPAGGVLEVLGVILVVLIILEFLGVTNVFTRA